MFSVYGITGQVFNGTLEEMNRVRALARARSARAIAEDGEEWGTDAIAAALNSPTGRPSDGAVRAYRAMLPAVTHGGVKVGTGQGGIEERLVSAV